MKTTNQCRADKWRCIIIVYAIAGLLAAGAGLSQGCDEFTDDATEAPFIDTTGAMVIPAQFEFAFSFREGYAPVMLNNKYGYIDKSGKLIIQPQFDKAGTFDNGLARVTIGNKEGYINTSGNYVCR